MAVMFARHIGNTFELVCDLDPDHTALIHGSERRSWGEFDDRAARLASALTDGGISPGDTVAINMYNCPEWLETFYAAIKIRAVPANVNYRYQGDELFHLLDDSDTRAVVFHASLADRMLALRSRLPEIRLWIMVDDDTPVFERVEAYESLIAGHAPAARFERPAGDHYLSYTGGTTGLPKGVLATLGAFYAPMFVNVAFAKSFALDDDPFEIASILRSEKSNYIGLAAPPLMHSTGLGMTALPTLAVGGTAVTMTSKSFNAHHTLAQIERHRANHLGIVGDAIARPLVHALDEGKPGGGAYDCSSLRLIVSAGVAWTASTKAKLFEYMPEVTLLDACGASEGVNYGNRISRRGDDLKTGSFEPGVGVILVDEELELLPEQIGATGLIAAPVMSSGYFNDPARTAKTYKIINGERYAIPGDYGHLAEDGSLTLLGRRSAVINTGGEKVHPDEVEDVIKQAGSIKDCLVFGLPDERFGQKVVAMVQLWQERAMSAEEVTAYVKNRLAGYKAPREVLFVPVVPRGPNGKGDYKLATKMAMETLGITAE